MNTCAGLFGRLSPENLLIACWAASGHPDRRAAWHRPGAHHRHAAAHYLCAAACCRPDHACRYLLRRAIWRLDHRHSRGLAGGNLRGGHGAGRPPNGAQRPGRRGLAIAALGSFFAGCVATVLLAGFAPPLAEVAFKFGPAEYFSLMVLGLIGAVVLASGSLPKAIA